MNYSITLSVTAILLLTACKSGYPELVTKYDNLNDKISRERQAQQEAVDAATGTAEYEGVIQIYASPSLGPLAARGTTTSEIDGKQEVEVLTAEYPEPVVNIGEMIVSVNFDDDEITGSASDFYEVEYSDFGSQNDLTGSTGTAIDGSLTLEDGYLTGSLTQTDGEEILHSLELNNVNFFGEELELLAISGSGVSESDETEYYSSFYALGEEQ